MDDANKIQVFRSRMAELEQKLKSADLLLEDGPGFPETGPGDADPDPGQVLMEMSRIWNAEHGVKRGTDANGKSNHPLETL